MSGEFPPSIFHGLFVLEIKPAPSLTTQDLTFDISEIGSRKARADQRLPRWKRRRGVSRRAANRAKSPAECSEGRERSKNGWGSIDIDRSHNQHSKKRRKNKGGSSGVLYFVFKVEGSRAISSKSGEFGKFPEEKLQNLAKKWAVANLVRLLPFLLAGPRILCADKRPNGATCRAQDEG